MEPLKKLSPGFYIVIILLFLLPFVNLSCSGQTIMSLTGFQLITGTEYSEHDMFGQNMMGQTNNESVSEKREVSSQPMALFALLAAVVGLAVSFIRKKALAIVCVIASVLGTIFLILLKVNIDGDAQLQMSGQSIIKLEYQPAYWLSIVLFILSAVVFWLMFKEKAPVAPIQVPPSSPSPPPSTDSQ